MRRCAARSRSPRRSFAYAVEPATLTLGTDPDVRGTVTRREKILERVLSQRADADLPFGDLCYVLRRLGFEERIRGGHHIFTRADVAEIINLQPRGGKAKPYQVRQVRDLIRHYQLKRGNAP